MNKKDKEFIQIVGIRVMNARVKAGLLQEQVAAMLNLSRPQIANIETGNCGTTPEIMYKLSVIFNCAIADLFPLLDQYKPKFKLPPARKSRQGRKVRGPNTTIPAYLLAKENEQLKKEMQQLKATTNER